MVVSRRRILQAGMGALSLGLQKALGDEPQTLRRIAASQQRIYGCAVSSGRLKADQLYAQLVAEQAGLLVAEGETKRSALQPTPNRYDFTGADYILKFAEEHGQKMRGHTLSWYKSNPDWLVSALDVSNPDEKLLTDYVSNVVNRYRGNIVSWDVVNEPVNPDQGHNYGMRVDNIWFKAFGERYIDLAFHAAKDADPNIPLFLNETNTEADVNWSDKIRRSTLGLIDRLISRNVPIDSFGMQGHLKAFQVKYSEEVISKFLDELAARGLRVLITEFDIADIGGPKDQMKRDAEVASLAKRFLDVAFSKSCVRGCVTWGITDRYSWLSQDQKYKWPNGDLSRGLPFDQDYKPVPMFAAIAQSFQHISAP